MKKNDAMQRIRDLEIALNESVKLQSFYAELLNEYDYGHRMTFKDADAWMARLRETKSIPERI